MKYSGKPICSIDMHSEPEAQKELSRLIAQALRNEGCCFIMNSLVDNLLIDAVRQASFELFQLPAELKERYSGKDVRGQRGYSQFGFDKTSGGSLADLSEFWAFGKDLGRVHQSNATYMNKWPSAWFKNDGFKLVVKRVYQLLEDVSEFIMNAIALDIHEDPQSFSRMIRDGDSVLRLSHYPPPPPLNVERSNLRCDRDLFSLVLQDGEAQIRNREGSLVTPGSGSGGILVIVGEMLENLTNGLYRSCLYRSTSSRMNRDKFARLVVSFFAYPCPGTNLGPRNLCIQEVGEGRYPAVSSEDFLGSRLQELYANF